MCVGAPLQGVLKSITLDENKTLLFFEIEKWQPPKEREIQTPWRLIDVRRYM